MLCGKLYACLLTKVVLITLLPSLIARGWVGSQTGWWILSESVSEGSHLNIASSHRVPVYGFRMLWLQIAIQLSTLFYHNLVIICFLLWCFTDKVKDPADQTHTLFLSFRAASEIRARLRWSKTKPSSTTSPRSRFSVVRSKEFENARQNLQ